MSAAFNSEQIVEFVMVPWELRLLGGIGDAAVKVVALSRFAQCQGWRKDAAKLGCDTLEAKNGDRQMCEKDPPPGLKEIYDNASKRWCGWQIMRGYRQGCDPNGRPREFLGGPVCDRDKKKGGGSAASDPKDYEEGWASSVYSQAIVMAFSHRMAWSTGSSPFMRRIHPWLIVSILYPCGRRSWRRKAQGVECLPDTVRLSSRWWEGRM